MQAWEEVLSRLNDLNKVCPNPPDPEPEPVEETSTGTSKKRSRSSSIEHSEHSENSDLPVPKVRVYQSVQKEESDKKVDRVQKDELVQIDGQIQENFGKNEHAQDTKVVQKSESVHQMTKFVASYIL